MTNEIVYLFFGVILAIAEIYVVLMAIVAIIKCGSPRHRRLFIVVAVNYASCESIFVSIDLVSKNAVSIIFHSNQCKCIKQFFIQYSSLP